MYYPFIRNDIQWKPITDDMVPNIEKDRYLISNAGTIYDKLQDKILSVHNCGEGYLSVSLATIDESGLRHRKGMLVHRLVGMAFIDGDWNKQINHKDGDKVYCEEENLEWVTPRENLMHALDMGLHKSGGDRITSHLTNEQAVIVKQDLANRMTISQILNHIGLEDNKRNRGLIIDIKRGKTYTRVGTDISYSVEKLCERRLDRNTVIQICEYMQANPNITYGYYSRLIDMLGIPCYNQEERSMIRSMIGSIYRRKAYTDISKNYNW